MIDYKFILKNKYFDKVNLNKWDILFDEWDKDHNLYIVKKWSFWVQKYTTNNKNNYKQLAFLWVWSIFWEWALKSDNPKEVKILALEDSELLKIDAKEWVQKYIKEFPEHWFDLLTEIIDVTNKRLLESNFLLTSNYEMSTIISDLDLYDNKNLFYIIDKFKNIIWAEYILYLEKNPVMDNYMTVKYDSRYKWKMQSNIVDLWNNNLDLEDLKNDWIVLEKFNYIENVKSENDIIWYLIIWERDHNFTEWQKKAISSITALIAWVIKQKHTYEEQKYKEFMKE